MDFRDVIDWVSFKLNFVAITFIAITGNMILIALGAIATASTIIYNAIRIYKELKNKKQ